MNNQTSPLSDATLNEASGGMGFTQGLASSSAAPSSTPVSSIIRKRDELQMSIIRKM